MSSLTGVRHVRVLRSALEDAQRLLPRKRDRMELRRQALKLRYWPEKHPTDDSGKLLDLDWSWIRALSGLNVGELRLGDVLGGCDNLRVIFWEGEPHLDSPLPPLWILRVMQKKRMAFSTHDLAVFRARRTLVRERFYE